VIERTAYFHHILIFYSLSYWKLSGRWMNAYEMQTLGQSVLCYSLASVRITL